MPSVIETIARKRDGGRHSADEIARLVEGFVTGEVTDYQMAAWLMAVCVRGLDADETVWLTDAMVRSGDMVDMSPIGRPVVDKHSTGGVGDKTTLVVAPVVAACGVPVGKMSGRGLGHTGGTLDKLESIPGFRTALPVDRFVTQVRDVGVAVVSQTPDIDPADELMYALRDVTATVPSVPLIVSSIMSKKVAGGADAVVLDVKYGSGAFMKTAEDGNALAEELVRVGRALGRRVEAVLSAMDEPLGLAVGNALEVREAVGALRGEGPTDLVAVCTDLASRMVVAGGGAADADEAREAVTAALEGGEALAVFRRWVEAQGGDPRVADEPETVLPRAALTRPVLAGRSGRVSAMEAEGIGIAAVTLGAGRARKGHPIDPAAGVTLAVRVGDRVERGAPLAAVHAASRGLLDAGERRLLASIRLSASDALGEAG